MAGKGDGEVAGHIGQAGQILATMHSPVVHETWASYRKAIAERRRLEQGLAFAVAAHERALRLAFSAGLASPPLPKRATYAATKAFVLSFSEALRI